MNMDISGLHLPVNPVIIDCGCNEGQWLSHVRPQLKGHPKIVALDMLRAEAKRCQLCYPDVLVVNCALVDSETSSVVCHRDCECSQCSSILKGTELLDKLCGHVHKPTVLARRHEWSESSSLLPMTEAHNKVWGSPTHVPVAEEQVQAMTLDQILALLMIDHVDLLKLDLQGYELHALHGALDTLSRTDHVISEVSWVELYEGQVLYPELNEFLESQGFTHQQFYDLRYMPGIHDPRFLPDLGQEEHKPVCGDALWSRK
jgi:FkbM family methyltransferase